MSARGRLPRLTLFAQSGGWQARRPPRSATLGPDREGEQPATTSRRAWHSEAVGHTHDDRGLGGLRASNYADRPRDRPISDIDCPRRVARKRSLARVSCARPRVVHREYAQHAANSCMKSSGLVTRCVVPSRQAVLSLRTAWPAALSCTRLRGGAARHARGAAAAVVSPAAAHYLRFDAAPLTSTSLRAPSSSSQPRSGSGRRAASARSCSGRSERGGATPRSSACCAANSQR
jgi:hypothetical protein